MSTSEQQKVKQPLDALSRHFKCGEEAEIWYNKIEDKKAKGKQMAILVLGGAGYIGSHMVDRLVNEGQEKVVVVDSLVTGHRAAVHPDAVFYQGDLADQDFMRTVLRTMQISMRSSTLRPTHWSLSLWQIH